MRLPGGMGKGNHSPVWLVTLVGEGTQVARRICVA